MLIYHQCGHNFIWNIQSILDDRAGDGLIISPVNLEADRVQDRIPRAILDRSWMDPQFYVPADAKNKLATYPFFPGNVMRGFNTTEFEERAAEVARQCLRFQAGLNLRYSVIPCRYFDELPPEYLEQLSTLFVEPFLDASAELNLEQPILLTLIVKNLHLQEGAARDELLSWATSYSDVRGVYLILDTSSGSKQVKDPAVLAGALRLIRALRSNEMEVHVGYVGLEGLVYSVADPTSITVGSYENLRSFGTLRLETREKGIRRGPRARVFSGALLQSIEDTFLPPLRELLPNWERLFEPSPYRDYLLNPTNTLNFQRAEVYKHYFFVLSRLIAALPDDVATRPEYLRHLIENAIENFRRISGADVFLDADSDDSHLPGWLNALAMFRAHPE